jgi:uncharacterized protein with von Willebrand factor type A (vWA) domain
MKLKDETPVEIVAIIDRSGSMHSIHDDSIGGFNSFLSAQKEIKSPANISVVLFDERYQVLYDDVDIQKAEPLTKQTYSLGGMTAMNDAIGKSLTKILAKNPERAIICILTDGQENASREFKTPQIKQMIEKAQGKGWQVVFLAANQDAFATGAQYGIYASTTANWTADKLGTQSAYKGLTASVTNYRGNKS